MVLMALTTTLMATPMLALFSPLYHRGQHLVDYDFGEGPEEPPTVATVEALPVGAAVTARATVEALPVGAAIHDRATVEALPVGPAVSARATGSAAATTPPSRATGSGAATTPPAQASGSAAATTPPDSGNSAPTRP